MKRSQIRLKLRLLIAGPQTKFFHLREFGDSLTKLGVEYKLVHDIDFLNRFLDTDIIERIQTRTKFNTLLQEFKPDVVLLDRLTQLGLVTLKAKIPLLVHLRGDYWSEIKWAKETVYKSPQKRIALWKKQKIADKCFKGATVVLPISKYLEKIVREHYPNKTTEVSYTGRNPSDWFPVKAMNLQHPCVGLLQGAGIWGKTKEMLILTKILEKMPNVTFYWAGDGPYRDNVLETLGKYENFKWLGRLQYPDKVREYLMGIDVYALVSGMDSLGQTILEASLMEKPVVATNVGGIPELVDNGKTGFLVEKGDYNEWIEKLTILINDSKTAKQMGVAGRSFIETNFSWDKIATNFMNMLNSHLGNT